MSYPQLNIYIDVTPSAQYLHRYRTLNSKSTLMSHLQLNIYIDVTPSAQYRGYIDFTPSTPNLLAVTSGPYHKPRRPLIKVATLFIQKG